MPQIDDWLYLFNKGELFESYTWLGVHELAPGNWQAVVWAPHALAVSIVGDFNDWQGQPLQAMPQTGMFLGTFNGKHGDHYKFAVTGPDGQTQLKVDPFGFAFEPKPGDAALLADVPVIAWHDQSWWHQADDSQRPMNIYEVHLGSFMRQAEGQYQTYAQMQHSLIDYAVAQGYTHIELLPLTEHLLDASWGYQSFGYFAPTSRFGTPADFLRFVDAAHVAGLGVIMDWVPGHFIKNTDVLYQFDGTPTFEYQDPHRAENVRWGTWNFDLGKTQVQSYLISSAMFWLKVAHLDGLRVDAVSNMLYMNYDAGKENDVNVFGGNENLEGTAFLKRLTSIVGQLPEHRLLIAEESSAYPKVTAPVADGGLGFDYKWNMGWMNDTLTFFEREPAERAAHLRQLTFSFVYMGNEHFVLPLSHDEVVHGKKSLMHKMPGDRYNQFANLRLLMVWLMTFPGKKLLFMGSEWGQFLEWRDYSGLEWVDLADSLNHGMQVFTRTLNHLYLTEPGLWAADDAMTITQADSPVGLSFSRGQSPANTVVVVFNFLPGEHQHLTVKVPYPGRYRVLVNTENQQFGGTWTKTAATYVAATDEIEVLLPALGALILGYVNDDTDLELAQAKGEHHGN